MRLLVLGHSGDEVPDSCGRQVQAALSRQTGETVEIRFVDAFPAPSLGNHVSRVLDAYKPDVVMLHCSSTHIGPFSLGPRMRTLLHGRLYVPLSGLRWIAQTVLAGHPEDRLNRERSRRWRLYTRMRDALLGLGLGAPYAPLDGVVAAYGEAVRRVVAQEGTVFIVRGPSWNGRNARIPRLQRETERRLWQADREIAALCAQHRVPFCSMLELTVDDPRRYRQADLEYNTAEGHALAAEHELRLLLPLLSSSPRHPRP